MNKDLAGALVTFDKVDKDDDFEDTQLIDGTPVSGLQPG